MSLKDKIAYQVSVLDENISEIKTLLKESNSNSKEIRKIKKKLEQTKKQFNNMTVFKPTVIRKDLSKLFHFPDTNLKKGEAYIIEIEE